MFEHKRKARQELFSQVGAAAGHTRAAKISWYLQRRDEGEASGMRTVTAQSAPNEALKMVREALLGYSWQNQPKLFYTGMRHTGARMNATEVDQGVITITGEVRTPIGVELGFDIPVEIRNGQLLEPSVMIHNGSVSVISQSSIDALMTNHSTFQDAPQRGMYSVPLSKREEAQRETPRIPRRTPGMFHMANRQSQLRDFIRTRGTKGTERLAQMEQQAGIGHIESGARRGFGMCGSELGPDDYWIMDVPAVYDDVMNRGKANGVCEGCVAKLMRTAQMEPAPAGVDSWELEQVQNSTNPVGLEVGPQSTRPGLNKCPTCGMQPNPATAPYCSSRCLKMDQSTVQFDQRKRGQAQPQQPQQQAKTPEQALAGLSGLIKQVQQNNAPPKPQQPGQAQQPPPAQPQTPVQAQVLGGPQNMGAREKQINKLKQQIKQYGMDALAEQASKQKNSKAWFEALAEADMEGFRLWWEGKHPMQPGQGANTFDQKRKYQAQKAPEVAYNGVDGVYYVSWNENGAEVVVDELNLDDPDFPPTVYVNGTPLNEEQHDIDSFVQKAIQLVGEHNKTAQLQSEDPDTHLYSDTEEAETEDDPSKGRDRHTEMPTSEFLPGAKVKITKNISAPTRGGGRFKLESGKSGYVVRDMDGHGNEIYVCFEDGTKAVVPAKFLSGGRKKTAAMPENIDVSNPRDNWVDVKFTIGGANITVLGLDPRDGEPRKVIVDGTEIHNPQTYKQITQLAMSVVHAREEQFHQREVYAQAEPEYLNPPPDDQGQVNGPEDISETQEILEPGMSIRTPDDMFGFEIINYKRLENTEPNAYVYNVMIDTPYGEGEVQVQLYAVQEPMGKWSLDVGGVVVEHLPDEIEDTQASILAENLVEEVKATFREHLEDLEDLNNNEYDQHGDEWYGDGEEEDELSPHYRERRRQIDEGDHPDEEDYRSFDERDDPSIIEYSIPDELDNPLNDMIDQRKRETDPETW